jgi:hypothetical protein
MDREDRVPHTLPINRRPDRALLSGSLTWRRRHLRRPAPVGRLVRHLRAWSRRAVPSCPARPCTGLVHAIRGW